MRGDNPNVQIDTNQVLLLSFVSMSVHNLAQLILYCKLASAAGNAI